MVPPTRRRILQGAAGLAVALTGCNGLIDPAAETSQTETPAADETTSDPNANQITDPATVRLRVESDQPPIWLTDTDQQNGGRPTVSEHDRHLKNVLIDSVARADRIRIADLPAADRARSFLENTDFDTETVYLETYRVKECFRLELCQIAWQPTHIETDYARTVRPYDAACGIDKWVFEAWLIRIPAALAYDEVNSHAASVGSGHCDRHASRAEADGEGGSGTVSAGNRDRLLSPHRADDITNGGR